MSKNKERAFLGLIIIVLSVLLLYLLFRIYALQSLLTSIVETSNKKITKLTDSLSESKKIADNYRSKSEVKVSFVDVFEPISSNSFQMAGAICKQLNTTEENYIQLLSKIKIPENYNVHSIDLCGFDESIIANRIYVVHIESVTGRSDIMVFDYHNKKLFSSESDIHVYGRSCEFYGSRKFIEPSNAKAYWRLNKREGYEHFIRCFATVMKGDDGKQQKVPILYVVRSGYLIMGMNGFVTCAREFGYCLDSDTINRLKDYKIIN